MTLVESIQSADWKTEKHVPVIECPDAVAAGESFEVKVSLGKEVAHPNTTEHHIRWIALFYRPQGDKFTYQVGHFEFTAHGESAAGPNQGPVHTDHRVVTSLQINMPGVLQALALCNIHGLWQGEREVGVR